MQNDGPLVVIDEQHAPILVITINRPNVKNAVDGPTARQLHKAFVSFAQNDKYSVAILRGAGNTFCAGADLKAAFDELSQIKSSTASSSRQQSRSNDLHADMSLPAPMGVTRMTLPKPVIACIEGYALAGGLELAAWCDLRVAASSAILGLPCRTRGVPLIDGGTVRLPALLGMSRAMDLILTGRLISAAEAEQMGLVNRLVVQDGQQTALEAALEVARLIASKPQLCMQHDRLSVLGWDAAFEHQPSSPATRTHSEIGEVERCPYAVQGDLRRAMDKEFQHGLISLSALGQALEDFVRRPKL